MQRAGDRSATETSIRHLLPRRDFRRLLGTRLLAQFGDGVFQAALAGTVLFNPQRAADPIDVAAGFAVLLLPYSFVGPFAGVWLDRWSRRQVLLRANVLRAGLVAVVAALVLGGVEGTGFYVAGLAVFSVNRFILAALSASLPHTVDQPSLVSANALSTTSGSVATVIGGGAALGLLQVVGRRRHGLRRGGPGGGAALPGSRGRRRRVRARVPGPRPHARRRLSVRDVLRGMAAGARHAWAHPPAVAALLAIGLHRFGFGLPHPGDAAALPEHVRGGRRPVPRRPRRPGRGRRRRSGRHPARGRRHPVGGPAHRQAALGHLAARGRRDGAGRRCSCRSCRRPWSRRASSGVRVPGA